MGGPSERAEAGARAPAGRRDQPAPPAVCALRMRGRPPRAAPHGPLAAAARARAPVRNRVGCGSPSRSMTVK